VPFKKLVHEAISQLTTERLCTDCLAHEGVTLPFELP
jgi:5'-methylthioadenosine phosphorylase